MDGSKKNPGPSQVKLPEGVSLDALSHMTPEGKLQYADAHTFTQDEGATISVIYERRIEALEKLIEGGHAGGAKATLEKEIEHWKKERDTALDHGEQFHKLQGKLVLQAHSEPSPKVGSQLTGKPKGKSGRASTGSSSPAKSPTKLPEGVSADGLSHMTPEGKSKYKKTHTWSDKEADTIGVIYQRRIDALEELIDDGHAGGSEEALRKEIKHWEGERDKALGHGKQFSELAESL
jgi:hypothetical protein